MEFIYINGEQRKYQDWKIINKDGEFQLKLIFYSGKSFSWPIEQCKIVPSKEEKFNLLYHRQKRIYSSIKKVISVGHKYYFVQYEGNDKCYLFKQNEVNLEIKNNIMSSNVFSYFKSIAQDRMKHSTEKSKLIVENVISQFERVVPSDETALSSYISRKVKERDDIKEFIFPFGINVSQMKAVKSAFKSQLSIIEGPPGTGKTQTILNIIANLIINGKNCAIVSNNNEAVKNVYEKLEEYNLDFFIAKLGREDNRKDFFGKLKYNIPNVISKKINIQEIREQLYKIDKYMSIKNRLAQIQGEVEEIRIEKTYLEEWYSMHPEIDLNYVKKYRFNHTKMIELSAYLKYIKGNSFSLREKWDLLIRYKIFSSNILKYVENRENFIFSLQYVFYERVLNQRVDEQRSLENELALIEYDKLLKLITEGSLQYLYSYLNEYMRRDTPSFDEKTYKKEFDSFLSYFPVIGSSTFSLINSIPSGFLFDYVIIDEASQQDLVPGILCFACARNVVIVGDRKQLPHIPQETKITPPIDLYDCTKYSLLDSVGEIFGETVPRTLLREHYRCHPKIIQFCNKQFYNGELVPMKKDNGEDALSLITTSAGNHMRNLKNQREIESLMKVNQECRLFDEKEYSKDYKVGFIAPYNAQVNLAKKMLPNEIENNTIHRFQGRDCNEIWFSTVLDKKQYSLRQMNFVDDAALINVAVSRAKDKFVLVTGQDVFLNNNKYIASLIRYIKYYGNEESIVDSPVISAFDLLYSEYDKSLERLANKLDKKDSKFKSEQIVSAILKEILKSSEFEDVEFHRQIYMKQLVDLKNEIFSEREKSFIKHNSSCDFVLYYKIGKAPFAVIEVDGGYHDLPEQKERDDTKNGILNKVNLALLRLSTLDSDIESKILNFIRQNT